MRTVTEELAMTLELCGGEMSRAAAAIFVEELRDYPDAAVIEALERCRREITGRLTLAHVIDRIPDGRPGPEEAWAMLPKDESETAVLSEDMRASMAPALAMLRAGDPIAARMTFLEAYRKMVATARARHEPVRWFVSLGHDQASRAGILVDAVRDGKITAQFAMRISRSVELERSLVTMGLLEGQQEEALPLPAHLLPEVKQIT